MNKELLQIVSQWLKNNLLDVSTINSMDRVETDSISLNQFEDAILRGKWDDLVSDLQGKMESNNFEEESRNKIKKAIFQMIGQKIREVLVKGDQIEALRILRSELTPMGIFPNRVHELAQSILMTKTEQCDQQELVQSILADVKSIPGLFYDDNRLEELIAQAVEYQKMQCPFHSNENENVRLWIDHKCMLKGPIVLNVAKTDLLKRDGLITSKMALNANGSQLTVAAKTSVQENNRIFQIDLRGTSEIKEYAVTYERPHEYSSWPRTDLTQLRIQYEHSMSAIGNGGDSKTIAVGMMPNKDLIVSNEGQITTLFDVKDAKVLHSWIRLRCSHILTPPDISDKYFLTVADDGRILQISTETYSVMKTLESIDDRHAVSSAYLDDKRLLIGFANSTLYYYEDWQSYGYPTRVFQGHHCINHRVNAILPKFNQNLVLACSEDGSVYGWNIQSGRLIYEIKVHEKCVFDIVEIGRNEYVTCGDDGKVYRWKLQ